MKWVFSFFLFVFSLFSSDQLFVDRPDGTKMIAYADPLDSDSFPVLFLIAGSQKESCLRLHENLRKEITSCGFCPISIEKRGITSDSIDEKEFLDFLNLESRVDDYLHFHKELKRLIKGWNGNIAVLGQGDGGRIGAQIALQFKSVIGIALIGSGGAWNPQNEALFSFRSEMADAGFSPQYIHGFLVQARREFSAALEIPTVAKKAFGYTHKYWESLLKTNLAQDLSQLRCPIYSVNGAKDQRVPIESVETLAQLLGEKIVLIRKEQSGQEIIQDLQIYIDAIDFLSKKAF